MTRPVCATRAGCLAVLLVLGCSPAKPDRGDLSKEEQAILNVALAYRDASNALQRGPASEKDLKPYLKSYGDPDQVLVSPNDGQPYQFTWGLIPSRPSKSAIGQRYLVYEKTGKDGKRYVVDLMLQVHHLSDQEFSSVPQGPN
jgi:hypothetical protein